MAEAEATAERVEYLAPDSKFVKDVIRLGGASAKTCYQCGTCSVSCNVAYAREGDEPFPRRLMLWTQWGLKDKVLADPSIWACHQCNDCSANCPRGAKPGDVLAALRALCIQRYSVPGFMATLFAEPRYLPLVFGIPALVLLGLLFLFQGMVFPSGPVIYKHFITEIYVEVAGVIVLGLAFVAAGLGVLRYWQAIQLPVTREPVDGPGSLALRTSQPKSLEMAYVATAADVALHKDFWTCRAERLRPFGHLAVFWGFPLLLLATALSFLYTLIGIQGQLLPLTDPMKIAGNVGGVLALIGILLLMYSRVRARPGAWGAATYFDWLLLWLIFLNVASGFTLQIVRLAGAPTLPYQLYIVHLIIVFASFAYVPYGKFAHIFYRTVALTAIRHGDRQGVYKFIVLLPASVAVAVGAVAVLVAVVFGVLWIIQKALGG